MASANISAALKDLKGVSYALNNVEVKGRDNLDILLGSMQVIDRSIEVIERALQDFNPPAVSNEEQTE